MANGIVRNGDGILHKVVTSVLGILVAAGVIGAIAMSGQIAVIGEVLKGMQHNQERLIKKMDDFDQRLRAVERHTP